MAQNSYTHALTLQQAGKLRTLLESRGWQFEPKEYTIFAAKKDHVTVAVYEKGPKILVQGKGAMEFVEFLLGVAREHGFRRFKMHAQSHLEAFYARHGFAPVGVPFMEAGIEHLLMRRED